MPRRVLTLSVAMFALFCAGHASARVLVSAGTGRDLPPAAVVAREETTLQPEVAVPTRSHAGVVAIDGDLALVGAPGRDAGGDPGVVYAFHRTAPATWTYLDTIANPAGSSANDSFGASIAMLGTVAVIGAPGHRTGAALTGLAYRFSYDGAAWVKTPNAIERPTLSAKRFGASVAITDGWIAVGAPDDTAPGAVVVYDHAGLSPAIVTHADAMAGAYFGASVALSGNALLVGAPMMERAFPFDFEGATWTRRAAFVGTGMGVARFGESVALGMDGNRALVGAPRDEADSGAGAVYGFERSGAMWPRTTGTRILTDAGHANDHFGTSVAMTTAGSEAVVGAPYDEDPVPTDPVSTDSGSAYLFSFRTSWTQTARFQMSGRRTLDRLGTHVAVSGTTVVVGASEAPPTQTGFAAVFPFPQAAGTACLINDRCESGFCVDGVCCNAACDGACLACSVAAGAATDGVCGADSDDRGSCTSSCGTTGMCMSGTCATTTECPDLGAPMDSGTAGVDGGAALPRYHVSGCKCSVGSLREVPAGLVAFSLFVLGGAAVRRRRRR